MKQKQLLILTIGLFTTITGFGQSSSKVSGQINDNNGKGVSIYGTAFFIALNAIAALQNPLTLL